MLFTFDTVSVLLEELPWIYIGCVYIIAHVITLAYNDNFLYWPRL